MQTLVEVMPCHVPAAC